MGEEELNDVEDYNYVHFDDDFPLIHSYDDLTNDDQKIFKIIKHCHDYGYPPNYKVSDYVNKLNMTLTANSNDFNDKNEQHEKIEIIEIEQEIKIKMKEEEIQKQKEEIQRKKDELQKEKELILQKEKEENIRKKLEKEIIAKKQMEKERKCEEKECEIFYERTDPQKKKELPFIDNISCSMRKS